MYQPTDIISDKSEIRRLFDGLFEGQMNKIIDHIDRHCRTWIERSPFVIVSTVDGAGNVDVSPKGDPAGFVKVLDEKTLAIPDRPGNKRGDSLFNILETSRVGLMFVVPKRREVVRVNGSAQVVKDPDLLASMAINGRVPVMAILVRVEEAFFHCGKSMIRSRMWQPEEWGKIDGLSSYAEALKDHANEKRSMEDLEISMANNEKHRLYDD